ncbi:MAG: HD-GYP domain-containing protein [Planctomycetaceae bacterium]
MISSEGQSSGYIPVSVNTLVLDTCTGFRLYLQSTRQSPFRLYCAENVPFLREHLDNLKQTGHRAVYISAADHEHYQQYLRDNLTGILGNESITVQERFSALNLVVKDVLAESMFGGGKSPQLGRMREMASVCVELLLRDDCVARDLVGVLHHDYHTFTHSANVAFYCVMLANALGISDTAALREIALGGFLHDLGTLDVPDRILQKPDRLNEREFDEVRDHPRNGFGKLAQRNDLSRGELMMVYQHHERMDGNGYPVGCGGREIHDWARLCSVVDAYEAMTSERTYRPRMSRAEALRILDRDANKKFDAEFVKCWRSTVVKS